MYYGWVLTAKAPHVHHANSIATGLAMFGKDDPFRAYSLIVLLYCQWHASSFDQFFAHHVTLA